MKNKVSAVINMIISIFLIAAVSTFLHPCKGEVAMPCNHSVNIAKIILGIVIAVNAIKYAVNKLNVNITVNIAVIAASILLVITPKFGSCTIATMTCNTRSFPALQIGGLLMTAFTLVFTVFEILEKGRKKNVHSK